MPHTLELVDIKDPGNEAVYAKYKYDIPVMYIDGQYFAKHKLSEEEAVKALKSAVAGSFVASDGEPDSSDLE